MSFPGPWGFSIAVPSRNVKLDDRQARSHSSKTKFKSSKQAYKSTKCARLSPILPSFLLSFLSPASLTYSVLISNHEISNSRYIVPAIFHHCLCAKQRVHSGFSVSVSRGHDRWAMRCWRRHDMSGQSCAWRRPVLFIVGLVVS